MLAVLHVRGEHITRGCHALWIDAGKFARADAAGISMVRAAIDLDVLIQAHICLARHFQRVALAFHADDARFAHAFVVGRGTNVDFLADVNHLVFVVTVAAGRGAFRAIEHILLDVSQRAVTLLDRSGAVAGLRKHGGHRAVKIGIDLFGAQRKKRVAHAHRVARSHGVIVHHAAIRCEDGFGFGALDAAVDLDAFGKGGGRDQGSHHCNHRNLFLHISVSFLLGRYYFVCIPPPFRRLLRSLLSLLT